MTSIMVRVSPDEILEDQPLPFNLYLDERTILAYRGQLIPDQGRLEILRRHGWRPLGSNEPVPANSDSAPSLASVPADGSVLQMDPQPPAPLASAIALVADDVRVSRRSTERLLRTLGLREILGAETGMEAITQFFQKRPHIVFLDIDMPGRDGLATLRQIKTWSPQTFACLVSGFATVGNVQLAKGYGVDAFLAKPITGKHLERTLRLYLETSGLV